MITRLAVKLFKNSNSFIQAIDTQYDSSFAIEGAKIGQTLRIRLPNDYTVRVGTAAQVQSTAEQFTTLNLQTQVGVDVAFSTAERSLSLDDYGERILMPEMNDLAGYIASDVMAGSEGGICNMTYNANGAGALITPNQFTYLQGQAQLNENSAPTARRKVVNDPWTDARVVGTLTGLFNPATKISEQYSSGMMKNALGFDWMYDQTVIKHTVGTFTAGTVNGVQTSGPGGMNLVVNAITGTLNAGDIITIQGVNAVNRVTKQTTGMSRQFVVTAPVASGATVIPIYPGIVPPIGGNAQQYQTVTASPANGATISLVLPAGTTYRKNIAFAPELVTLATADLEVPRNLQESARESYDGISIRMLTQYNIGTDQLITRLDVIYGYLYIRPEWGTIIPDIL